jgi:DNA-directed RNA polymerase specialized sigma24 family protein
VTYRRVLELRFLRGYSIRETALELGLSQANVRVMQFRALNRAGREHSRPTRSEREFPEQQALQEI